ncbi:hypothetical protein OSB04_012292 [Centaurea solstitialis]|uniref:Uncharacterized protein n=1 Tax=Centaurea solstitialis TaxID=347529 RepID=A0AA38TVU7_9ASTR|nr:hypothetical protein OSB04_012292 [Centaurea solstitialis]
MAKIRDLGYYRSVSGSRMVLKDRSSLRVPLVEVREEDVHKTNFKIIRHNAICIEKCTSDIYGLKNRVCRPRLDRSMIMFIDNILTHSKYKDLVRHLKEVFEKSKMVNTHGTRHDELVERGPRHERPDPDFPERNELQQPCQGATASVTLPEHELGENEVPMGNVEPNDPQAELRAMIAKEVAKAVQNTITVLIDQLRGKHADDQVVN